VEEESSSPVAQVQTWLAWRGRARTTNQARPGEDFTGAATAARGATPPGMLRLVRARSPTESTAQPHQGHLVETREVGEGSILPKVAMA
jgi:hypothetical protein